MTGEQPLDGVEDVAWDDLLRTAEDRTATGAALIGLLRDLAGGADPERTADRIGELLTEDADYFSTEWGLDHGFVPGAAAMIPFLARIAAAHPRTAGPVIDLIRQFVNAPLDRPGATDAELDALQEAVRRSRDLLATAADRAPAVRVEVASLLAEIDGGAYPPRWRGVARPLARADFAWVTVVADADRLLIAARAWGGDLIFLNPDGGATVAALPPQRPMTVKTPTPGPGAVVVNRRRLVAWRHLDRGWATTTIRRGHPFSPRITALATAGGELYAGFTDGTVTRLDPGTGKRIGGGVRRPGAVPLHLHPYRSGDDQFVLVITTMRDVFRADPARGLVLDPPAEPIRGFLGSFPLGARTAIALFVDDSPTSCVVRRFDAATGTEIGPPIATQRPLDPWATTGCVYTSAGRPMLAVGSGRQIHRFDAETGAPSPVLTGHRSPVTSLAAAVVGGRPTLFSADGVAVRRWDAETGTPWPAPIPTPGTPPAAVG